LKCGGGAVFRVCKLRAGISSMPRRAEEAISRIHIQVFSSDLEILESIYGDNIGISPAIRKIIRLWLETNNIELGQINKGIREIV